MSPFHHQLLSQSKDVNSLKEIYKGSLCCPHPLLNSASLGVLLILQTFQCQAYHIDFCQCICILHFFLSFFLSVSALREKRTEVVAQLKQLQSETEPIVKMFEDPETTRQMQSTRYIHTPIIHSSTCYTVIVYEFCGVHKSGFD